MKSGDGVRVMNEEGSPIADQNELVMARWDARMRQVLSPLIVDELIAEHERDPLGVHSDDLKRVLNYFRRTAPKDGKYVVVCVEPFRQWSIARLSGVRGRGPAFVDDRTFGSEREAMHAVFLRRIEDLLR
jgi:branched-chain amino acid transport system permease protein